MVDNSRTANNEHLFTINKLPFAHPVKNIVGSEDHGEVEDEDGHGNLAQTAKIIL